MKKYFILALSAFLYYCPDVIAQPANAEAVPFSTSQDDFNREAKVEFYILHDIEAGETLYSLAKTYKVDVNLIKGANPDLRGDLSIGTEVRIPQMGNGANKTANSGQATPTRAPRRANTSTSYDANSTYFDKLNGAMNSSSTPAATSGPSRPAGRVITPDPTPVTSTTQTYTSTTSSYSGKTFQQDSYHTVQQGETLYSLSKKYNVQVDQLRRWNNLLDSNIKIGQQLIVQKSGASSTNHSGSYTPPAVNNSSSVRSGTIHTVKSGETLYSISRIYGTTVDRLKQWNNITSNTIALGQELVVSGSGGTYRSSTPSYNNSKPANSYGGNTNSGTYGNTSNSSTYGNTNNSSTYGNTNNSSTYGNTTNSTTYGGTTNKYGSSTTTTTTPPPTPKPTQPKPASSYPGNGSSTVSPQDFRSKYFNTANDKSGRYEFVQKEGVATWFREDFTTETDNMYALHKEAQIHSIMRITNPVNGNEVFVKVIGRLPDTVENEGIIIKLPSAAAKKLNMRDEKLKVKYSYYQRVR